MPWEGTTPLNLLPMVSIIEVSDLLISLRLLRINMWERTYPTVQVWSTCIRVDAASWWSCGQYTYTVILRGCERRYGKLTLFASVYFTGYASNRSRFNRSGWNPPTEAPQVSTVVQVPFDIFTGTLQGIVGFTSTRVQVLVDHVYDSQESVLYWKFTYIK